MTLEEMRGLKRGDVVSHATDPTGLGLVTMTYDASVFVQWEGEHRSQGPFCTKDDAECFTLRGRAL